MATFDLPESGVRRILNWVHCLQVGTLFVVGSLIAAVPYERFGRSWDLVLEIPAGRYVLGVIFVACSLVMGLALHTNHRPAMGAALRVAGINALALALFLLIGSLIGPTGVTNAVFACYLGVHLILQSVLLNARGT